MHVQANFSIDVDEGTVYDQRYYTAAPLEAGKEWPHMMSWMVSTFGPCTAEDGIWVPSQRWYANNARFWFRDQADLTLFLLRWNR
jgi:hypothetical protein